MSDPSDRCPSGTSDLPRIGRPGCRLESVLCTGPRIRQDSPMARAAERKARVARALGAGLIAFAAMAPATALAAPTSAATSDASPSTPATSTAASPQPTGGATVTASGTAAGDLAIGSTIQVRFATTNSGGWQHLDTIHVSLELHGAPLDRIEIVPTAFSIAILGSAAPVSIGDPGTLKGTYLRVDNGKATVSASGDRFSMTFPMRLALDPPPGARLGLTAADLTGVSSGDVSLTPPVTNEDKGFPWGTIGLAVAAALFIGGF